ncbi:MAG: hypothetical protein QM784_02950 [Polyangiaceae bacterium]
MSMPAVRVYLPRFPDVQECSWVDTGKCQDCTCRYSLLAERPRITEWASEDVAELVDALPSTCALDLAAQGPMLLEEISAYLGLPRTLVEQTETLGLRRLSKQRDMRKSHWDGY